jgi:hypothetical protein
MTATTKSCPYCLSDIPLKALACQNCGRDVHLFGILQEEISRLESENQILKSLSERKPTSSDAGLQSNQFEAKTDDEQRRINYMPFLVSSLATVCILSFIHWFLLFFYDTPIVIFRLITFVIPVLLGVWTAKAGNGFWLFECLIAMLTGVASVLSMLNITHQLDGDPLLPQNHREWKEAFEYAMSIALALFTGLLLWRADSKWKIRQKKSALIRRNENGQWVAGKLTHDLQEWVSAVAPVVSGGMAVYASLKSIF